MDKDTIEIHSYLIRDSVLYTLLIVYFLFFLLLFLCIVNFRLIKRFLFGPTDKHCLLPLHSANLNRQPNQRYYDKYKYTNLNIKSPSDYDSLTEPISDDRNLTAALPHRFGDARRPATLQVASPPFSQTFSQFSDPKRDLITFPTLSPSTNLSEQEPDRRPKRKSKCDFKLRNRKCFNRECKRRNILSKIFCKYYSRLRPSSFDQSDSATTDQSSVCRYSTDRTPLKPAEDDRLSADQLPTDKELDREKALKCYQDFLENRFCRPNGSSKSFLGASQPEDSNKEKDKKNEELKRITDEAASRAKILTPKQLRNYEPFKVEIASPVTRPKPAGKEPSQGIADEDAKDQCKYVELPPPEKGKDLKKRGPEEDFNFLRLADDLRKSKSKEPKERRSDQNFVKSKKFYLPPERGPDLKNKDAKESRSDFDEDDSEQDDFFDLENLSKNKRTIPDLNKMYRQRTGDLKETTPSDRSPKDIRLDGRPNGKPSLGDDRSEKQPPDEDMANKLRKEIDQAREKDKRLKKPSKPSDKMDELSSSMGKSARPKAMALESPFGGELGVKSRPERGEGGRKEAEADELAKGSDESISPLVDRMKSEMKILKPIEFKPLQTVYLKEKAKPSEEISELKISKIHKGGSQSPSLNSERLISRNMDLNGENLISDKPDDLMKLSKSEQPAKPKDGQPGESPVGKVNLNNVLSLKDRQLEKIDKPPNRPLNVTSIDRQPSNEASGKFRTIDPDQFEQIGKIDSQPGKPNKLVSVEKQHAPQATGKKSKIPLPNDKLLKKSKSLTLYKKGLFGRNRPSKDERIDRDLEKMFNLKFKR